jgi:lipoprotein-releasing system permease protein
LNFLFAWRYFRSKKSTNAINIIAWISVVAIAVGTTALIIVLSVFNGFEDLVKGLYGDFYSDLKISASQGKVCKLTKGQIEEIRKVKGVRGVSLIAEEKAVLRNEDAQSIIFLKGVDENYASINKVSTHIARGKYILGNLDNPSLVIGAGIESAVAVDPETNFYPLLVYLPNKKATSLKTEDALFSDNVDVTGTFTVQQEFDNKYAFTNLAFMKYMLDMQPDEYTGAEIATIAGDEGSIDDVKERLQKQLGNSYKVESRYEQNQSLYTVMQMEKWVIYGILCLILVVAAFNMIGALTMLVLEKQKDIAVLKAMGAGKGYIQSIFLSEGFLLAFVGGAAGILLAVIICYLQVKFKFLKLTGGTFIIDYYPVKMIVSDFVLVVATVFFVSILAAWIPSRKAAAQEFSLKS